MYVRYSQKRCNQKSTLRPRQQQKSTLQPKQQVPRLAHVRSRKRAIVVAGYHTLLLLLLTTNHSCTSFVKTSPLHLKVSPLREVEQGAEVLLGGCSQLYQAAPKLQRIVGQLDKPHPWRKPFELVIALDELAAVATKAVVCPVESRFPQLSL